MPDTCRIRCRRWLTPIDRHLTLLEEDAPVTPQRRQRSEGHLTRAVENVVHRILSKETARGGPSCEEVLDGLFVCARLHRLEGMAVDHTRVGAGGDVEAGRRAGED